MGYYTQYKFSILELKEGEDESVLISKFRDTYESAEYAIDSYGETTDECKWYSYEKDIIEFSKNNKEHIFLLEGEGEDNDCWKLYAKAGFTQYCKGEIVYPEFDRAGLLGKIRNSKIDTILK